MVELGLGNAFGHQAASGKVHHAVKTLARKQRGYDGSVSRARLDKALEAGKALHELAMPRRKIVEHPDLVSLIEQPGARSTPDIPCPSDHQDLSHFEDITSEKPECPVDTSGHFEDMTSEKGMPRKGQRKLAHLPEIWDSWKSHS